MYRVVVLVSYMLSSFFQLFQINDAWARDYESLSKRIDALTSGNWTNGSTISTAQLTATHPPSFTHNTHVPCATCHDFEQQLNTLQRQMKEKTLKCEKLGKTLEKKEIEVKRKDLMIERLDSENQAIQLQVKRYIYIQLYTITLNGTKSPYPN